MQDLVFFLGRFHVLALHLPVGIVIAAVALDWIARRERHAALRQASTFLWGAAAISAVATAVLGYLHFAEGGFTGASASAHRLFGTLTALACVAVWWLTARSHGPAQAVRIGAGIVLLVLVTLTGHYGGNLTHGTEYLREYAPSFLRPLLGAAERRPRPASVADADPYLDVVQALLQQRCGTCHNDDKRESGFSVASYDSTLVGGDTGRAIVPGNLEASELFYRVTLPPDDQAFMPAEGKTPLTAAQIEILRWWIAAGAPRETTVANVGAGPEIEPLLAAELGLADSPVTVGDTPPAAVDPSLVEQLSAAGLLLRQVAADDARLVVSPSSPGTPLGAASVAALAAATATLVDLNLGNSDLDDTELAALGALPAVTHLRLARNGLTDGGLGALRSAPNLEHLNLYGNTGVTDAGLAVLAEIASLREVYLWKTGATAAGVARLRERRPDLLVDFGAGTAAEPAATTPR